MRCLIFAGGEFLDPRWHRQQIRDDDFVLCADGGAEYALSLGVFPKLVVGDMDSLSEKTQRILAERKVPFVSFPAEKDETDTELALIQAVNLQPEEIIIFAGLGNRSDHSLANIFLLVGYLSMGIPLSLRSPLETLQVTNKSTELVGFTGQTVSLLAISETVKGLTLRGFYYPLDQAVLRQGSPRGISNVMQGNQAMVELTEGILLIVQQHTRS